MRTNIIYSHAGVQIVTQPYTVGHELEVLAEAASSDFVKSLDPATVEEPVTILDILNGGRFYALVRAWENTAPRNKKANHAEVRASRYLDKDTGAWGCRIYSDTVSGLNYIRSAKTILIGDTVATGSTLERVIRWIFDQRAASNDSDSGVDGKVNKTPTSSYCTIHVFSIAGGDAAVKRLAPLDEELRASSRGEIRITFANAIFKLAENGTDLGFVGAVYDPKAQAEIEDKLGAFAPRMKCAVWDWGERFYACDKHLDEITEYFLSMSETPKWLRQGLKTSAKSH